jgi:hypothetical protein
MSHRFIAAFRTLGNQHVCLVYAMIILSGLNSGCTIRQLDTERDQRSVGAYASEILSDVYRKKPWLRRSSSGGETIYDSKAVAERRWKFEFKKGKDDPNDLLSAARTGDLLALGKLEYYYTQVNENWRFRFEVKKMMALRRGVGGIAGFYVECKSNKRRSRESRLIEQAIKTIEVEALRGSLAHAAALYQFCGSLDQVGETLPGGDIKILAEKWLERVFIIGGEEAFSNVVKYELMRMGLVQSEFLKGDYFPHTRSDWMRPSE